MCGIIGWKFWDDSYVDLQRQNSKRGGYSTGMLFFGTVLNGMVMRFWRTSIMDENAKCDNMIIQFRTPTGTSKPKGLLNQEENYPLEYKGWKLFGNGVINAQYYTKIKDEKNNNDLYYILKNCVKNGWEYLKEVEGTFALVFVSPESEVYLIRKDFPLYYSENCFSSVKFEGGKTLEHGVLKKWYSLLDIYPEFTLDLELESVYA